jgi:hypothetical protein
MIVCMYVCVCVCVCVCVYDIVTVCVRLSGGSCVMQLLLQLLYYCYRYGAADLEPGPGPDIFLIVGPGAKQWHGRKRNYVWHFSQ